MAQKQEKPTKSLYLIEVSALVPATIKYRVLAENEEEAYRIYKKFPILEPPQYKVNQAKCLKTKIYDWITGQLKLIR